jgi:hypothetical protein
MQSPCRPWLGAGMMCPALLNILSNVACLTADEPLLLRLGLAQEATAGVGIEVAPELVRVRIGRNLGPFRNFSLSVVDLP